MLLWYNSPNLFHLFILVANLAGDNFLTILTT